MMAIKNAVWNEIVSVMFSAPKGVSKKKKKVIFSEAKLIHEQ